MRRQEKYADTQVFHFHNANPKNKITDDCVIRAIATATGTSWDEVMDGLFAIAKKYKLMPTDPKCFSRYLESLGWKKHRQPRKHDNKKYSGAEFCQILQEEPWIFAGRECVVHTPILAHIGSHHIVCIKDGQVWDSWDSSNGCIGNYWTKD